MFGTGTSTVLKLCTYNLKRIIMSRLKLSKYRRIKLILVSKVPVWNGTVSMCVQMNIMVITDHEKMIRQFLQFLSLKLPKITVLLCVFCSFHCYGIFLSLQLNVFKSTTVTFRTSLISSFLWRQQSVVLLYFSLQVSKRIRIHFLIKDLFGKLHCF